MESNKKILEETAQDLMNQSTELVMKIIKTKIDHDKETRFVLNDLEKLRNSICDLQIKIIWLKGD